MALQEAPHTYARTSAATGAPFFRPRRFGHANIFVSSLERSMAFYRNVVGLEEAWRRQNIRGGFLNNGNTHHDVGMVDIENPQFKDKQPGLFHLAFELENQVDLLNGYRRGIAEGMNIKYAYDHEISQSIYTPDPDGTMVEIYADTEWRWWEDRYLNRPAHQMPNRTWKPGDTPASDKILYDPHPVFKRVEEALFHPLKITTITLIAANYEAMVDYYVDQVGLTPKSGGRAANFVALGGSCGGRDIVLFRASPKRPAGFHHMSFVVADEADLGRSIGRIESAGVTKLADIDHPSRRSVVIADPDGLRVEFHVERSGTLGDPAKIADEALIYLL